MAAHLIHAIHRGAVDIVAVVKEDGSIAANPFHIKLCHSGDFKTKVKVQVNGKTVATQMRLNESGHAVFVQSVPGTAPTVPASAGLLSKEFDQLWMDSYKQVYNESGNDKDDPETDTKGSISMPMDSTQSTQVASSNILLTWNLVPGINTLRFQMIADDAVAVSCSLYLWKWSDKIIVSDIDGTITKSDVRGQILSLMEKDWTHPGVAPLFKAISENGYRFLYLTARAIAQFSITKTYLNSVEQDGRKLPAGPLLLSDSSLYSAFIKEVIDRRPDEFKIDCLEHVAKLFPSASDPFYAGFGNRPTDVTTYKQFIKQRDRIYTVNPKDELVNASTCSEEMTNCSSYCKLMEQVEKLFPKVQTK